MARISDKNRTVFKEAYKSVLDNFTEMELEQIGKAAEDLRTVIEGAKQRLPQGEGERAGSLSRPHRKFRLKEE
jgi:hypothetical protein